MSFTKFQVRLNDIQIIRILCEREKVNPNQDKFTRATDPCLTTMNARSKTTCLTQRIPLSAVIESESRRDKLLRVRLLFLGRLAKRGNPGNYSSNHEEQRHNRPYNTPALGRAPVAFGKHAGIGTVDFSQDQIVALGTYC